MKIKHIPALLLLATAPVAGFAAPAVAHDGSHPFKNCSDAKANGYSNIPSSDSEHYAKKLDRDGDGYGCDKHGTLSNDGKEKTGYYAEKAEEPTPVTTSPTGEKETSDKSLAETGGDSNTPYIAAAGGLLLVGGGVLAFRRKRTN